MGFGVRAAQRACDHRHDRCKGPVLRWNGPAEVTNHNGNHDNTINTR